MQVKAINEINLNEEYIDASISIRLEWEDDDLKWSEKLIDSRITSILVEKQQIWIPDIGIVNRVNDFSPNDEKKQRLTVTAAGVVDFRRNFRMRTMISSKLIFYPFDVQVSQEKKLKYPLKKPPDD